MAGTLDMLYNANVEGAPDRLARIIYSIFESDENAAVIVGHIPMIGLNDEGAQWVDIQRRVAAYNARISALVDQLAAQGYSILKTHSSASTLEHQGGDYMLPNAQGYLRIAYDFAETIIFGMAANLIQTASPANVSEAADQLDQESGGVSGVGEVSGGILGGTGPATSTNGTDTVVCTQDKSGDNGQGAPSSDEIMASILRGYTDEDMFIASIACNHTEICKLSIDGTVSFSALHLKRPCH
jgi:hypothetical protein